MSSSRYYQVNKFKRNPPFLSTHSRMQRALTHHAPRRPPLPPMFTFIKRISKILQLMCEHNDRHSLPKIPFTGLFKVSITHEIEHMVKQAIMTEKVTRTTVIVAMIFLDRVQNAGACVSSWSVRRLFGTCIILAAKFLTDSKVTNAQMLPIVDCWSVQVANDLELRVLELIHWRLFVSEHVYKRYETLILAPLLGNRIAIGSVQ